MKLVNGQVLTTKNHEAATVVKTSGMQKEPDMGQDHSDSEIKALKAPFEEQH
jgi:hypothetical protein